MTDIKTTTAYKFDGGSKDKNIKSGEQNKPVTDDKDHTFTFGSDKEGLGGEYPTRLYGGGGKDSFSGRVTGWMGLRGNEGDDKYDIQADKAKTVGLWGGAGNDDYTFTGSDNKSVQISLGNSKGKARDKDGKLTNDSGDLAGVSGSNNKFLLMLGQGKNAKGYIHDDANSSKNTYEFMNENKGDKNNYFFSQFQGSESTFTGYTGPGTADLDIQGKDANFKDLVINGSKDKISISGDGAHGSIKADDAKNATIDLQSSDIGKDGLTLDVGKGDTVNISKELEALNSGKADKDGYLEFKDKDGDILKVRQGADSKNGVTITQDGQTITGPQ